MSKLFEVQKTLKTNLEETSFIKDIKLDGHIAKCPDTDDEITSLIITMDDHVDTQLHIIAVNDKLVIQLSQMEVPPPSAKVRVNYLDSSRTCKGIEATV